MARQIKFRVCYTAQNGEKSIIQSDDCQFFMRLNGCLYENYGRHDKPMWENVFDADYIIQQFTGLLDKNNKEIYEGDVVKTDPDHFVAKLRARRESEEYTEYTKGQVRWVNEGFMVCQEHIGATRISEYSACDCCPCGLEIIGNIFENPELLLGV